MTADAGQRLLQTGERVLRVAQRLHALPLQGDLPAAFRALAADPAARLEDLLEPLLPAPEPLGQGQFAPRATAHDPWQAPDAAPERPHAAVSPGVAEWGDHGRGLRALPAAWSPDPPGARPARPGGRGERREPDDGPGPVAAVPPWPDHLTAQFADHPAGEPGAWPGLAAATSPDHPAAFAAHAGDMGEGGEFAGPADSAPQRAVMAAPPHSDHLAAQLADLPALAGIYRAMAALRLPPQPAHPGGAEQPSRSDVAGTPAAPSRGHRDRSSGRGDRSGPTRRQSGLPDPGGSEPRAAYPAVRSPAGPAGADGSGPVAARSGAGRPVAQDNAAGPLSSWPVAPGGADPNASVGLRLAQGAAGLAALLGANLDAGEGPEPPLSPPEGTLDEGPGPPVTAPDARPPHRAAQGAPGGEGEPPAGHDLEQLIDELADRLEFELARTYGTSGG